MNTDMHIKPECLYPLAVFKTITGFGAHAMRTARKNGLRIRYVGGRAFVLGGDFIAYTDNNDQTGETK